MIRNASLVALLILFSALSALEPPRNLEANAGNGYVNLSWESPMEDGMYELCCHDGAPSDAYVQLFDQGYGAIFDLSGFEGCTLAQIDFRHSSYGITGNFEYKIHLIDWSQQTELGVITSQYTLVNDAWEQAISLGNMASATLVGVFIEPMGNDSDDAYPVVDCDGQLDYTSYVIDIDNYQILTPGGASGDFLIDLWVTPAEGAMCPAPRLKPTSPVASRAAGENLQRTREPHTLPPTRDLTGFRVYRNETLLTTTPINFHIHTYADANVVNGQTYSYYVTAVYDEGESNPSNIVEASPQGDPSQIFFEGFEGSFFPATWTRYDADSDGYQWAQAPTGIAPFDGNKCVWSQSYDNGAASALTPDNWMITPAITLPEGSSYVKYYMATQDADWPSEHYQVLLSTTGTSTSDFTTVLRDETLNVLNYNWRQVVLSLSQWSGQTVHIAWRHCQCTNNYAIKIDNVEVSTQGVATNDDTDPVCVSSLRAWPNPFNPVTTVAFSLESPARARLTVYNIRGERVAVLADEQLAAGSHEYVWQGQDDCGRPVSSGMYFCRLESAGVAQTCKLVLLK